MQKDNLIKYFQTVLPMSAEKAELLAEKFYYKEYNKNDLLLKETKISSDTYFLEEGLVRTYTLDIDGNEVTSNIYTKNNIVNDFLSFFKQQPSTENIEALTNCKVWYMNYNNVQKSFHGIPEFREWGRLMLVNNYEILKLRTLGLIKLSAEQRYQNLMNEHPTIFQNVPLKIIASYLGITDTSLSRIRKEFAKK
ncbi:MAG: Crp/Fnr family transcriptional regulator [Bacteroidia bacterium]